MKIDIDEKIEGLCNKCKTEIEKESCTRCGKETNTEIQSLNKNFDKGKFEDLVGGE